MGGGGGHFQAVPGRQCACDGGRVTSKQFQAGLDRQCACDGGRVTWDLRWARYSTSFCRSASSLQSMIRAGTCTGVIRAGTRTGVTRAPAPAHGRGHSRARVTRAGTHTYTQVWAQSSEARHHERERGGARCRVGTAGRRLIWMTAWE